MRRADPRLFAAALLFVCVGILLGLTLENVPLRYLSSITAIAVGFGLLRRAFHIE